MFFRKSIFLLVLGLTVLLPTGFALKSWQKVPLQPGSLPLRTILPHPLDPSKMLAASAHELFEGALQGPWHNVPDSITPAEEILDLAYFEAFPDSFFILTANGIFKENLTTRKREHIFSGNTLGENTALSMTTLPEDPDHLFVGTRAGLFESDDGGRSWSCLNKFPGNRDIVCLVSTGESLFVTTQNKLYASNDLWQFSPLFAFSPKPELLDEEAFETGPEEQSAEIASWNFTKLIQDPGNPGRLFLATRHGVFETEDHGENWARLTVSGLGSREITDLVYAQNQNLLFAGTQRGIFVYDFHAGYWREMYEGIAQTETYALALVGKDKHMLAAATRDGLMVRELSWPGHHPEVLWAQPENSALFRQWLALEPSPDEIRHAVIRYANAGNEKTKRWHWQSRLSSLLPSLSFGHSLSRGNSVDIDRGSTSEPDVYIEGPEDLDRGWDFDVRWDLAGLFWDSSHTSIDSREKYTIELRYEMVSEAMRLYFERRRLQSELVFSPPSDPQTHFNQRMRLEELTALLNALSDGLMEPRLKKIEAQYPELRSLWEYRGSTEIPGQAEAGRMPHEYPGPRSDVP